MGAHLRHDAALLAQRVEHGELEAARNGVRALAGRHQGGLDAESLCRAAVASVAESTADAVVAPPLYGALFGVPGVVAYRRADTLGAMAGHRSPGQERLGRAASTFDDVLGWFPARITAVLAAAAAPSVAGDPRGALAVWLRDGHVIPTATPASPGRVRRRARRPARRREPLRGTRRGPRTARVR